jgi:undecaprenyl-phosphate 4-deoxy-4-formamido-L-arabinose transferase
MGEGKYLSVVIPVFNEEASLIELYGEITVVLNKIDKDYEVIFVDDGSSDRGPDIMEDLRKRDKNVRIISFCRNFGQHAAVMAGFRAAKGDIVITLDADLQNPPAEIQKLVKKIEEGYDVVAGWRQNRRDTLSRRLSSRAMNLIISKLTGVKLNDYGCMLRAYRRKIIGYLLEYGEKSVYIPAFTSWLAAKVIEVPVSHKPRKHGKSKYSLLKFLRQAFDLITAYTLLPIQLISITGAVFAVIGFFLACYLMSFRIFFGTTSPLTTFVSALLFFSGMIMLALGIVSEYLARIYIETRKTPLYIIKTEHDRDR